MSEQACALCGRNPAAGFAMVDDKRYCHGDGDPEPTCYMRFQWEQPRRHFESQAVAVQVAARLYGEGK